MRNNFYNCNIEEIFRPFFFVAALKSSTEKKEKACE
ncbi:hypothetical protein EV209_1507 [Cuneatibacter caecimuris]|uniref:Uncharacterized protein n=1 Tax=Cuneatibacter caecimuris TaxID=1796618 RepID=A0A4V2F7U7_9FIRM|nr:hypothetical protein EV209_1507 [Cuneatibacter caecimuris]